MIVSTFEVPRENRYFEDYQVPRVYEFGSVAVTQTEIIEFARRFDPQDMHVDPEKAKQWRFGGIVASGWHTVGLAMRLYVDQYLSTVASLASPGVDEVRWPNPVRPGDSISTAGLIFKFTKLNRSVLNQCWTCEMNGTWRADIVRGEGVTFRPVRHGRGVNKRRLSLPLRYGAVSGRSVDPAC